MFGKYLFIHVYNKAFTHLDGCCHRECLFVTPLDGCCQRECLSFTPLDGCYHRECLSFTPLDGYCHRECLSFTLLNDYHNLHNSPLISSSLLQMNDYIVRSYRDVIVVTNTSARRTNKA